MAGKAARAGAEHVALAAKERSCRKRAAASMSWRLCFAIKGYTTLIARAVPGDGQGAYIDLYDFDSMLLLRNHLSNRF